MRKLSSGKGNVDVAADSLSPEYKLNRATQFIRDEIANDFRSITGTWWDLDSRTARFPPFDAKTSVPNPVPYSIPPHGNSAVSCEQCPVLGRVGRQLMQYYGHRLTGVRA